MNPFFSLVLPLALALPAAAQTSCTAPISGNGCGGVLTITFSPEGKSGNQRIDILGSNLQPAALGLMVWGYNPTSVPLGGGCELLVEFAWGHLIQTNDLGEWGWSRVWPASSMPGYYYIQLGSFVEGPAGDLTFRVSDARRAECH
jgi:hypothetical protein